MIAYTRWDKADGSDRTFITMGTACTTDATNDTTSNIVAIYLTAGTVTVTEATGQTPRGLIEHRSRTIDGFDEAALAWSWRGSKDERERLRGSAFWRETDGRLPIRSGKRPDPPELKFWTSGFK